MKQISYLLPFLFVLIVQCKPGESRTETPDTVVAQFNSMYPNASNVTWEKEDTLYEATFEMDTVEKSVAFRPNGEAYVMETEIHPDQLPQSIKDYVAQQLGGKAITAAALIIYVDGVNKYEAEVENKDYLFDAVGQFVSVEDEPNDD